MNDGQMHSLLDRWYRDRETPRPQVQAGVSRVMADMPQIRQRSRWWPLPVFYRRTRTPTATDTTEYQPTPIPATNGHTPTVTGRTQSMFSPAKAITAGALVFAIGGAFLIAQPFDQQGASVPVAATDGVGLEPASVTGAMKELSFHGGGAGEIADGVWHEEGDWSGRFEMDDSRLTGDATGITGRNRYQIDENYTGLAEVSTAAITIENDGGAWEGSLLGVSGTARSDMLRDTNVLELTGTGGYEGLSALLFVEQVQPNTSEVYGVIVPGVLLPEVPVDALSER